MNMKAILPLAVLLLAPPAATCAAEPRPNIVFILVDDLRWDDIACAGNPFVKTPNIDRIVNMGYQAVRTERWKYIHYTELDGMDELYDLQQDPYEMSNLLPAGGADRTLTTMQAELIRLLRETGGAAPRFGR